MVIVCSDGKLYVADTENNRIRQLAYDQQKKSWKVSTIAGNGTAGFSDGTTGEDAQFRAPFDIACDIAGNLYVSDTFNHSIRQLVYDSKKKSWKVSTIAGDGTYGFANGTGITAKFGHPVGLTCDKEGKLYVSDTDSWHIRRLFYDTQKQSWEVSTVSGNGRYGTFGDTGVVAKFKEPYNISCGRNANNLFGHSTGLACDSKGNLFGYSNGIACDSTGNIYIADVINHSICKIAYDRNP